MLARALFIRRLLQGGRRRRGGGWSSGPYGSRRRAPRHPRQRGRGGFFGPFPYYSTRTRRGSRVTVSGCCLPIPLAMVVATAAGLRALVRRG
jgi:hypothetical protein